MRSVNEDIHKSREGGGCDSPEHTLEECVKVVDTLIKSVSVIL